MAGSEAPGRGSFGGQIDGRPTVCIVYPGLPEEAYSERFIQADIQRLPARVIVLMGGDFPQYSSDGKWLLSRAPARRLARAAAKRLLRLRPDCFERAALRRFLVRNRVDAVLAEFGPTCTAVMGACREAQVPLVAQFHGYDAYHESVLEREGARYRALFGTAARIVVKSRDMHGQLLRLGAPAEKVAVIPTGADPVMFNDGRPGEAPPHFVAVGRFVDKKAPHLTLLAFAQTVRAVPAARLRFAGRGPLLEACRQMTRALRLGGAVEFLGPMPHAGVASLMRQARAFVQHSLRTTYGDSEGTPGAVSEAQMTGLPVVATRHAGIGDAVIDGETGLLVEEGDVDGMAAGMIRLAEDAAFAARLGTAARSRALALFSMDAYIGRLWSVVADAIASGRGAPVEPAEPARPFGAQQAAEQARAARG